MQGRGIVGEGREEDRWEDDKRQTQNVYRAGGDVYIG